MRGRESFIWASFSQLLKSMATLESVIQGRQGKRSYYLAMYSNLEFFDKLKQYFKNNLGLKNVTVWEPRTFISGESYPADWNMSVNAKIGLDPIC